MVNIFVYNDDGEEHGIQKHMYLIELKDNYIPHMRKEHGERTIEYLKDRTEAFDDITIHMYGNWIIMQSATYLQVLILFVCFSA